MQVASRLRALELDDVHYASDSDAESATAIPLAARQLRRIRAAALAWIIDRLSSARATAARLRVAAEVAGLPTEHVEAEDFALVPASALEWEHVVNGEAMRLMAAIGCK
jgi:hypothetical protein